MERIFKKPRRIRRPDPFEPEPIDTGKLDEAARVLQRAARWLEDSREAALAA